MLFAFSHGKVAVIAKGEEEIGSTDEEVSGEVLQLKTRQSGDFTQVSYGKSAGTPSGAKIGACPPLKSEKARPDRFGYLFEGTPEIPVDADAFGKLGRLGAAMIGNGLLGPSGMPSILTFFGQFIDHDITANTDRDPKDIETFSIDRKDLVRNRRRKVSRSLGNLRRGSLRLDSVYGDGTDLDHVLRDGNTGPEMRVGLTSPVLGAGSTPQGNQAPQQRPFDLPRIGPDYLDEGNDPAKLPDFSDFRSDFGDVDQRKIALIGDARNDENLLIAQMHVAFLKLHNHYVGTVGAKKHAFIEARKLTRWHYQWMIVNAYLPLLCDPATLACVLKNRARIYGDFADRITRIKIPGFTWNEDAAPIPLEFSVAAFRHGHSMIRASYRINERANGGSGVVSTAADIFQHVGRGGLDGLPTLNDDFVIDWHNFLDVASGRRTADHMDPSLSPGLDDLVNEPRPFLRNLAQRNLRRGYVLNLPYAQDVLATLDIDYPDYVNALGFEALTEKQFRTIKGGQTLIDEGYADHTPLWYYILAESELVSKGKSLGPLGSLIVAETLLGLIIRDPESYWHAGDRKGSWRPKGVSAPRPKHPDYRNDLLGCFKDFLQRAGVLLPTGLSSGVVPNI